MAGRGWAFALALLALAGCAGPGAAPATAPEADTVALSWREALVIMPGEARPERMEAAAPRLHGLPAPVPVVVFAHGCAGLDEEARETLRLLAANGFAAIAPDHLARPGARPACPIGERPPPARGGRRTGFARQMPVAWTAPPGRHYVARRLHEIDHAVGRVGELPWVDPRAVFLVGHSLGRGTAGLWPTGGVTAVAVLDQDCRGVRPGAGFEVPVSVPVLPLADRRAGWAAARPRELHCGELAVRPASGGLVIDLGGRHRAAGPETRRALLRFLLGEAGPA